MDLWQKLTIDWPCLPGDWLLANIWVPLATLPHRLTMRRIVFVVVLLVAAVALAQLVTADAAWFLAGDLAFYCEIASAVAFIVVRGHVRQSVHAAKAALKDATRRVAAWCRRSIGAGRQRGAKKPVLGDAGSDDDGPASWLAGFAVPAV